MSKNINVKYENYIPKAESPEKSSLTTELLIVVLFVLSGCPNSWNIQDALWLELAWFEGSQPEGNALASWLILMQAISALCFLGLFYIETHVTTFPKRGSLYSASFATLFVSIALTLSWDFTVDGVSVILLLGTFVGQIVGWVQFIFVIPWIAMHYNPRLISAFVSGNAVMVLSLVIVQIIQEPGGDKNFNPTLFFLIAGIMYVITVFACVCTFSSGIGRITSKDKVWPLKPWRSSLWTQSFPSVFWEAKLYTFGRVWSNQWSWTVIPIALPYAADNTTISESNDGECFLQWAVAVGYVMMLAGSLGSYIPTGKYWIKENLILNTISNTVILIAASNIGEWSSWPMRVLLMVAVSTSRFSYGWIIPMCMRGCARRFPEQKELLLRSSSLWSLYANILFRILLWMISSGVIS